ncbi:GntR family transcriptional regulator, phosphonate transport system regulatory protein [Pseudomonas cuatrocienegasensis]|uniref:GntR family transcriptional regulator, phosphonate transport system regulatory protein n=1 Tax=Pseudomonas cuatrocienegasensis TaxID=543360 RepID=A0ABY1B0I0_9PSED|nr:GntR family transcriptional regulator, phosphonate transport system regulatory protein [Pseudomonas cuatrocienegasensis]
MPFLAMHLSRQPEPMYRELAAVLRDELQHLSPGDYLPGEVQLAARFAVNRHTLRLMEGQPVSLIRHAFSTEHAELLADYQGGSLRHYLSQLGLPLTRAFSLIGTRLPSRDEAARLLMPQHAPLLRVCCRFIHVSR